MTSTTPDDPALALSLAAAAALLGVSQRTFRRHLIDTGRIRTFEVGRRVLVSRSEIARVLVEEAGGVGS